ncbi:uncharacterized protein LOC126898083 [Daktulosphaira vitifoliae]|uniref:uncharacterized protein LOC126898083 n=1 Tax=Daktulosphaira vitifoliae TaxID=58002 RepID=UPI0021AA758D|nr:uncharacterized protein LOC126898083 [Daktulosphaira vitifoliae]
MNCLSSFHKTADCNSTNTCRHCSAKHHSLLHLGVPSQTSSTNNNNTGNSACVSADVIANTNNTPFSGASRVTNSVVLGTAIVRLRDTDGDWISVRALIDTGSQISVITNACVNRLGLKRRMCNTSVTGLSDTYMSAVKGSVACVLSPKHNVQPQIFCEPIILSRITGLMPNAKLTSNIRKTYTDIDFADPNFDSPGHIDFLLGADIYPQILGPISHVRYAPGLPSAYETMLGWIIVGQSDKKDYSPAVSLCLITTPSIDSLLNKFWEIEEPAPINKLFTKDQKCEEHFICTTTRDSQTGRFVVSLPFQLDPSLLGSSRDMAVSRFLNLERKLIKDPILYNRYREFMSTYEDLGHMKIATQPGKYHLPHHAVIKHVGEDMKIRVVFDASARSSSDICQMYRQIKMNNIDCQYQHIVWRNYVSEPLRDYELTTVTFGVCSSPFQAIRVLHKLEKDSSHLFPAARGILSTQTYVDDILAGDDTIAGLLKRQKDIMGLLYSAGFELKKWSTNCIDLLNNIPLENRSLQTSFDPKDDTSIKILGLRWIPASDSFSYHTTSLPLIYTKRAILSYIAKLYDPIGALGPIIFWAKCFMQLLWQSKVQWDDQLPQPLCELWKKYADELILVNQIKVPRYLNNLNCTAQLIGFSDASEKGYAAVVYLRLLHMDDTISVHFISSKSKVAPIKTTNNKTLTVPRLELCGALLLAQLLHRLHDIFKDNVFIDNIYAWTDSRVVLSWLTSEHSQFKVFVTNRIAKILEYIPKCQWRYVVSDLNSADCISRGMFPSQAIAHTLYWQGPSFLKLPENEWPHYCYDPLLPSQLPDYKITATTCLMTTQDLDLTWLPKFSNLNRLQRVLVRICRLFKYARRKREPFILSLNSPISYKEKEDVMSIIIRLTQQKYFNVLFKTLQSSTDKISPRSLAQLAPFLDDNNIIRVGGRLRNATIPYASRHPVLLPKSCPLSVLLIRHFHLTYFHAGPQLLSSILAKKYWILSSRSAIRNIIFACVICARHRATAPQPFMADLPLNRVTPSRAFLGVGIDFAGPILIKESRRRNARAEKGYLCLFVCTSIKAVHIEVVSDLSTEAFLASLQRFIARRGIPSDIYSDCASNFKGANHYINSIFFNSSAQDLYSNSIPCKWHFNPPAAPHMGGLWEAAVKSCKYHLKRVVGTQMFTFEEMTTLSSRIEAVLNSRPLISLSSNPNDLTPLTPAHFIIGQSLLDIPEPDMTSTPQNHLTRWQLIRQLYQSFWKRWSTEYITTLQRRSKWYKQQPNVNIGDIVVINMPNQPPTHWKLGVVEAVHPGPDQIVRIATIRTAETTIKRPVVKLAVLPTDPDLPS